MSRFSYVQLHPLRCTGARQVACAALSFITAVLAAAGGRLGAADLAPSFPPRDESFATSSHVVGTYLFHWYTETEGQYSGCWRPLEGRERWTGEPESWEPLVKQIMAANIDVVWVHLIDEYEEQRVNLFRALRTLRAQGYDVPKVAPFLDPEVSWSGEPPLDLGVGVNKDRFCQPYIRFYRQYFRANRDWNAEAYLARIGDRLLIGVWHTHRRFDHQGRLSRHDVEGRLRSALADEHPAFKNGCYLVTNVEFARPAIESNVLAWADERVHQFDDTSHYLQTATHCGVTAAQIKPGYWDQNIRSPGAFLPRRGGAAYREAWRSVDRNAVQRVYIESFNEYDEGTGIYAAEVDRPPVRRRAADANNDIWSAGGDPYEYLRTTANAARAFNDRPDYEATILTHEVPEALMPGATVSAAFLVRNDGDMVWDASQEIELADESGTFTTRGEPMETEQEAAEGRLTGGAPRGWPVAVKLILSAPKKPGVYRARWRLRGRYAGCFGDAVEQSIRVGQAAGANVFADKRSYIGTGVLVALSIWAAARRAKESRSI